MNLKFLSCLRLDKHAMFHLGESVLIWCSFSFFFWSLLRGGRSPKSKSPKSDGDGGSPSNRKKGADGGSSPAGSAKQSDKKRRRPQRGDSKSSGVGSKVVASK